MLLVDSQTIKWILGLNIEKTKAALYGKAVVMQTVMDEFPAIMVIRQPFSLSPGGGGRALFETETRKTGGLWRGLY